VGGILFGSAVLYCQYHKAQHPVVREHVDLRNKAVIVTGANSGIGRTTAQQIASFSPEVRVILACRNVRAGEEVAESIAKETNNRHVEVMELDLVSYDSIRRFVKDFEGLGLPLHALINNAGIMTNNYVETPQGIESTFATNHLGPFLLTNLLLPKLKETKGRVVMVSSDLHYSGKINLYNLNGEKKFNTLMNTPYCNSKLANVLFAFELNRRLEGTGVTANAVHPGIINTPLNRESQWFKYPFYYLVLLCLGTNEYFGAQTSVYAAVSPDLEGKGGLYLRRCAIVRPSPTSLDLDHAGINVG